MSRCIKALIDDIDNNQAAKTALAGIGDEMWSKLKAESELDATRIWTEHAPPSDWDTVNAGVFISAKNADVGCVNPCKALKEGDKYLVINYSAEAAYFSATGNFLGFLPYGTAGQISIPGGYYGCYGADLNADNTKLAFACYGYHFVRCFDHVTGAVLWTFGDGHIGLPADGQLRNPRDCAWLPNGNLLVSCAAGIGTAGNTAGGYLLELDGADGHFVAIKAETTTANKGRASRGGCSLPGSMAIDRLTNTIFICNAGTEEVAGYTVDDQGAFDFAATYKKPSGVNADAVNPQAVCICPDNVIAVYSAGMRAIAGIDRASKQVKWGTGMPGWDNRSHPLNLPHELDNVHGLIWDDTLNRLLACDYGNVRIMGLATSNHHKIQYQVTPPVGYRLKVYPRGYDPITHTLTVPVNEVENISYTCDPQKAGHLVLGWERDCAG